MSSQSELSTTEKQILSCIKNKGSCIARQIAAELKLERSVVNNTLYEHLLPRKLVSKIDGTPPVWKSLDNEPESKSENNYINIIFVDLGNIHDILPQLDPYADSDNNLVFAFADLNYNGYGIRPLPSNPSITVYHSQDAHKNAADIKMVWTAAEIVINFDSQQLNNRKLRFFIFTKDNGFRTLKSILQLYSCVDSVEFVQRWDQIRSFIE